MKLLSSLLFSTAAVGAGSAYGHEMAAETFRHGFELCVIAHDAHEEGASPAFSPAGRPFLITLPAILSSSDLKRAKAVTQSSWYILSGNHLTSTLLLKLESAAVDRMRAAIARVVGLGDQVAILLDGEVVGVLVFQRSLSGNEIAIDASFFSDGTEKEKEMETRRLARLINSTLY